MRESRTAAIANGIPHNHMRFIKTQGAMGAPGKPSLFSISSKYFLE